jgi:hypothetical protein
LGLHWTLKRVLPHTKARLSEREEENGGVNMLLYTREKMLHERKNGLSAAGGVILLRWKLVILNRLI